MFPNIVIPKPVPDLHLDTYILPNQPHTPTTPHSPEPMPNMEPNLTNNPSPVLTQPVLDQPQVRRSTRTSRAPTYLQDYQCQVSYPIQQYLTYDKLSKPYRDYIMQVSHYFEPRFYHQAVSYPEWRKAMEEEIAALELNNTWTVQPLPLGKTSIGCRWLYKVKYKADGTLDRYKARLVAQGFIQQAGIDFLDIFSPIARLTTVRILLSLAAQKHWHFLQLDINNAFLD